MRQNLLLAPNQRIEFSDLRYPKYASYKLDGIRCLVYNGSLYSRNWKPFPPRVQNAFESICDYSRSQNLVFDGELYVHGMPFSEVTHIVKGGDSLECEKLGLWLFDALPKSHWDANISDPYTKRLVLLGTTDKLFGDNVHILRQHFVDLEGALSLFNEASCDGFEGLMLRGLLGIYKHGRATLSDGIIYKFKSWATIDAQIVGFNQATSMTPEYRVNNTCKDAMGYAKRTSSKNTRVLVDGIGSVVVRHSDGSTVQVCFKEGCSLRDTLTWQNRHTFIGKWVEYEAMLHGVKDKPRFGRIVRLRPDLDT